MSVSESTNDDKLNNGKVIIVGSINQDLTTYAPSLPLSGQTILGTDFVTTAGGKGANQAVAASLINVVDDTIYNGGVHMIGRVGNDSMGTELLSSLIRKGVKVNVNESKVEGAHTGVASINVDTTTGQNTIVVAPGANLELKSDDIKTSMVDILGSGSNEREQKSTRDVVLVQLEITPEAALETLSCASKLGAITILNPAPAPKDWELSKEWYSAIDILVPNETELAQLCGLTNSEDVTGEGEEAMAKALLDRGVRQAVIVTLGERGAMIVKRADSDDDNMNLPSYNDEVHAVMISEPEDLPCKSQPVVDTVGAGDAFCGALAAYLSRGVDLEKAASMACGVASMSVRKRGAQGSYPSANDLPECLKLERVVGTQDVDIRVGMMRKTITFVTGNKNKLMEVQRLLSTSSSNG